MLVLIVVIGTVAGSLTVLFSRLSAQSAQSLRERQALGLAQTLLNEVRMMPMTFCDPTDPQAPTATAAVVGPPGVGCVTVEGLGPELTETRYNAANRFDNVSDYHNLTIPGPGCGGGICDIAGNLLNPVGSPLNGCSAVIATTPQAIQGVAALDANGRPQSLRIVVTVRCPGRADTVAEGIRMRHSPNQL